MMIQLMYAVEENAYMKDGYLGISRMYQYLSQKEFDCKITELICHGEPEIQLKNELDMRCHYFGFSMDINSAKFIFKAAAYIKAQLPHAVIFCGSIFATCSYDLILKDCPRVCSY